MYKFDSVASGGENEGLNKLFGRVEGALEQGLLPVEVFCDDKVFRAEMDRIFTRNWVFVAHDSEIPTKGDFVQRRIGLDQVIVIRDETGKVNVLLNHCSHRGSEVCHEDQGNAKHFKCPYHGWVYKINGDFAGAPHFNDAYAGSLDAKKWGLRRAPKVESYHGFIFACLDENAVSLKEYLGEATWALDAIFGLHPQGMKVMAPPERFIVKADWKSGAENFCGDAYHVSTAHIAAELSEFIPGIREVSTIARGYDFGNGNSFIGHELTQWGPTFEMWAYPPETRAQFDLSGFDPVQVDMIKNTPPTIGTIFPNFSYLRFPQPATPGGKPVPFTNIRMWQPVSPGVMEMWTWEFEYAFLSDEDRKEAYLAGQFGFGSGGIFEMDDTAVWEGIAKMAASPWSRRAGAMLNYQQKRGGPDPEWKGPGQFHKSIYGEYLQQGFWRRWLREMREGDAAREGSKQ
ncbi:aromatic ring-hydroxylating oxygenase subunit alpha [Noviherbaspirillum saxi]|uniref:Aromatic ring-hydroxylating dioxygenase subunit alpha n=1 Tax=Noviherbaspirillum saxi TaxID=2320863 RepID=A0A3A3G6I1_9BURK|nr:Rieske 2Fe-2S domain-containing protein [Noviherbaspirillum saxi]RJF95790.1 aromatic ring-hydroxylating dioxygenase subunit alpha [Noviherbaspirillum saxi]